MHLLIDGYNLLHSGRTLANLNSTDLQRERDRLIDQLANYRQAKSCPVTVVFDGWQGGWFSEKREKQRGLELIYSQLGEKADEVIKRLIREKGAGLVVVTSDREISRYAEKMAVAVISSDLFKERLKIRGGLPREPVEEDEEETRGGMKKKGPSRRLSKKDKRRLAALKKI